MSSLPPYVQPDPPELPAPDLPPVDASPPIPTDGAGGVSLVRAGHARQIDSDEEDPQAGAVPPGYDWPTHGGYLGCLLGLMASCVLCGAVGAPIAEISDHHVLPAPLAIVLTLLLAVAFAIILGRVGWVLGRRFYREYPQPAGRRTWYQQQEEEERAERAERTARLRADAGYTDAQ